MRVSGERRLQRAVHASVRRQNAPGGLPGAAALAAAGRGGRPPRAWVGGGRAAPAGTRELWPCLNRQATAYVRRVKRQCVPEMNNMLRSIDTRSTHDHSARPVALSWTPDQLVLQLRGGPPGRYAPSPHPPARRPPPAEVPAGLAAGLRGEGLATLYESDSCSGPDLGTVDVA